MLQTSTVQNKIVNLGTRSFRQKLEILSGKEITIKKLARLNKDLEMLYEFLYNTLNTISRKEAIHIESLLQELLNSTNALLAVGSRTASQLGILEEAQRLDHNILALEEIRQDLLNFRTSHTDDEDLSGLLANAASLLQNIS